MLRRREPIPLIGGQRQVNKLAAAVCSQVDILLVRLPRVPRSLQQAGQVLGCALVGSSRTQEGIVVVEHAKVGSRLGPQIVGLRGMNVGIVSAGSSQHIVVGRCVRDMLAHVHHASIDQDLRGSSDIETSDVGNCGGRWNAPQAIRKPWRPTWPRGDF